MKIELCMGSSCFARGNARLLKELEAYCASRKEDRIELSGHLCLGDCSRGPNVRVDGVLYQGLGAGDIIALLEGEGGQDEA